VILALLALIVRGAFFSSRPLVIAGQALAVVLLIAARVAFESQKFNVTADPADGPLVRRGPYRLIRHPMYAGALLLIWAGIAGHWSMVNAVIGAVVLTVIALRIDMEERLLISRYPDYVEYRKHTRRIIPFIY